MTCLSSLPFRTAPPFLLAALLSVGMLSPDRGNATPASGSARAEHVAVDRERVLTPMLPARPRPATQSRRKLRIVSAIAAALPLAQTRFAGAPGANPTGRTLVLYDNDGAYAWLGEAYAVMAAQLASHGSAYVIHPASSYQSGELLGYSGMIYVGSTYDSPLPTAMLDDVLAGTRPVLWMNDNIWQLAARDSAFAQHYGWAPQLFDYSNATTVTYKGVALKRDPLTVPSGLLTTTVTDPALATVVATVATSDGTTFNWATRAGNLTYIGEIPFSYVGPDDRYLAAADLISQVSNPAMPDRKRALVRIEDVSADADPAELRAIADYLSSKQVPFSVGVIPLYLDPNGYYTGGISTRVRLTNARSVVLALKYMQTKGGTLIMHGYTHQYAKVANPYSGVTADDFEFYRSHISTDNYVIYDGPPKDDSVKWVTGRIQSAFKEFSAAGLAAPKIFEAPHYAASAIDYTVFQKNFTARYDRGLYASGWCPAGNCGTGKPDYTRIYGQYFPYLVRDIFGSVVIPESLGNVEPEPLNHNPPRFPADILASAQRNTVIRDGVLSFFFHPYLGINDLRTIVEGVQGMGYEFVPASTVSGG
jgi:uncharacterized protein YdaL